MKRFTLLALLLCCLTTQLYPGALPNEEAINSIDWTTGQINKIRFHWYDSLGYLYFKQSMWLMVRVAEETGNKEWINRVVNYPKPIDVYFVSALDRDSLLLNSQPEVIQGRVFYGYNLVFIYYTGTYINYETLYHEFTHLRYRDKSEEWVTSEGNALLKEGEKIGALYLADDDFDNDLKEAMGWR